MCHIPNAVLKLFCIFPKLGCVLKVDGKLDLEFNCLLLTEQYSKVYVISKKHFYILPAVLYTIVIFSK